MKIRKFISLIIILFLIIEILSPIMPKGVLASENADTNDGQTQVANEEQTSEEVSREYEIKEEETWDVSENGDGTVIAKWTLSDKTLRISGNGKMRNWESNNEKEDWHNSQYINLIEKLVIESGVENIGNYAFENFNRIMSLEIPETVTTLGNHAFSQCTNLMNIKIVEGLANIGNYTFRGCSNLTGIEIPESVTVIGSGAFSECSSLTSIKLPQKLTKIEDYTFENCNSLINIEMSEYMESIGGRAFSLCSNLATIEIPRYVTNIDSSTFRGCDSLKSINVDINNKNYMSEDGILFNKQKTEIIKYPGGKNDIKIYQIPQSVTTIEDEAFSYCRSLNSIEIPQSVINIGNCAFEYCESLNNIEIPKSITSIGYGAFEYCISLTNIEIPEGITTIAERTFYECNSLTSIEIPKSITNIEFSVFEGCDSLTNIEIPENTIKIGQWAFYKCNSLASIKIPQSVEIIGDQAFDNELILYVTADSVAHQYAEDNGIVYVLDKEPIKISTNYRIKDGETWDISENNDGSVIAKWTMNDKMLRIYGTGKMRKWDDWYSSDRVKEDWHNSQYTSKIEKVVIEEGITNIGSYAFQFCNNLRNIEIPDTVTELGQACFEECTNLTDIKIPEGVTDIGRYTFIGCSSLTHIDIPEGIKTLERNFVRCSSLTSIEIPESVTSILFNPFGGCDNLKEINVNTNNKYFMSEDGVLFNKDKTKLIKYPLGKDDIKQYQIPKEVINIENSAFEGCSGLTNIEIPEGVKNIGDEAFSASSIISIEIPKDLTSMGKNVFQYCSNLTNIELPECVTEIEMRAFYRCTNLRSIKIPEGVTSIGTYAFSDCTSLTNIEIPKSVTSIGVQAFSKCSSLTSIEIPESVTTIGSGAFSECSSLSNIKISANITRIENNLFSGCSSLTNIVIPEKVTGIENRAFADCNRLKGILLPENIVNIENEAIDKETVIYTKINTVAHEYAEKEKHGYILDGKGPDIKILTDKVITNQKQTLTIPVEVKDNYEIVGVKEGTIKYVISDSNTQSPSDEEFINDVTDGKITYEMQEGKKYIWVRAEDNLGNVSKVVSQELNLDLIVPKLEVAKTPTEKTNQKVTVTIKANEEIQKPEGWELSSDNKIITKEYTENIEETITIKDLAGNETKQIITIDNIDKTAPEIEVSYSTKEETEVNVTVEIKANEELQSLTGWNLSTDKKKLTREYSRNTKETITVKDIAGNEKKVEINIQNIKTPIKIGDINADDKIDITDIILLKRHLIAGNRTNWILTGDNLESADMNENGKVDISDLLLLKREVAQNI